MNAEGRQQKAAANPHMPPDGVPYCKGQDRCHTECEREVVVKLTIKRLI